MDGAIQTAGNLTATASTSLRDRFARKPSEPPVDKAAKDFEGMFLAQMLQPMFDTVGVDPLFGGGHGEEAMRGFLVQEYGKVLSQRTNFGIAAAVQAEMMQKQQTANAARTTQSYGATNGTGQIQ